MAKSPSRDRRLRRLRNVSSFLEESTESATPSKTTMNVIVDVHHEGEKMRQRDNKNVSMVVLSDDKETKQSDRSGDSKSSLRHSSRVLQDRNSVASKDRSTGSRDCLTVESFDLIQEIGATERDGTTADESETKSFPEVKPRRRKQWNTANTTSETEDSKRPPRKRWSKDTSVIRLPEKNNTSPLVDESHRPVPAPRSSASRNTFFDNPAFVSENEEVLRIETDHRRESTKIEMRKMSDHSNVEEIEKVGTEAGTSSSSSSTGRKEMARSRERFTDSDTRSSKAKSSKNKKNSYEESNRSPSLRKITDIRSSSITSEEPLSETRWSKKKNRQEETRDRSSRRRDQPLLKKQDPRSDEISSSARDLAKSNVDTKMDARIRRKKRKKKKTDNETEKREDKPETRYISVTVHRADVLEADYVNAKRPMVKVHIVKTSTGDYLRNTEAGNREHGSAFLQPMITGKFDFKENKSMMPVWEEELIFEHDYNAVTKPEENDQVVILFEVIDLLSFAEASYSYEKFGSEGCWKKIAWAFLKPVGTNNTLHTDKKVRLQLYRPKRSFKKYGKNKCEVYTWWQSTNRDKYPSSLFVTVTSVSPPKLEPVFYRQLTLDDHPSDARSDSRELSTRTSDSISLPKWARLAAQSCKIPNERIFETEASENGCFYVAFSSDGKYLACVHSEEYNYPIVVYEIETSKIHVRFHGHKTFVYSLNWSSHDHRLLSASADQTARIWDVRNQIVQHIELLPHPSYVYCAKYGPGNGTIVATGCYDQVARIWTYDKRSRKRELSQELEGHEGFVNSMAFQKNGNLITADSVGVIIIWMVRSNSTMPSRKEWCASRKIKVREIEGVVINTIVLHPLESRLLVHSRNNGLRMLDLATGVVLQKYGRLNNQRIQSKACISPCGSLILCGDEEGSLKVWSLETGKQRAKYRYDERKYRAVTCVDYHPYDHVLAFSTFGGPTPVQILRFNKDANGSNVGLEIVENESQSRENMSNQPDPVSDRQNGSFQEYTTVRRIYEKVNDETRHKSTRSGYEVRNFTSTNHLQRIIEKIDKALLIMRMKRTQDTKATDVELMTREPIAEEAEEFKNTKFFVVNEHQRSSAESLDLFPRRERYSRVRPKSAKEIATVRIVDRNQLGTLSDSAANSTMFQPHDHTFQISDADGRENIMEISTAVWHKNHISSSSDSVVISMEGIDTSVTSSRSTPNSGDTYVIDSKNQEEDVSRRRFKSPIAECMLDIEKLANGFH